MRISEKLLLTAGACALVPSLAVAQNQDKKQAPRRPNIIHIMSDDHSFQTISAYGHPISQLAPTPNIDRLASQGVLFRRAYVENSLSTPSRACLMTGLYSNQNGQRQLGAGIDTTKTFFSELLHDAGYQTFVVGKWHMRCEPKGFDRYYVLNDQGQYYNPVFKSEKSNGKYIREEGYATNLITDHALELLDEADPDKPFCMLIHNKAPHREWNPDLKYVDLYEDIEFPYPETLFDDYSSRGEAAHTEEMRIADHMRMREDLKVVPRDGNWDFLRRLSKKDQEKFKEAYLKMNEKALTDSLEGKELLKWKYQRYLKDYLRCIKSVDDCVGRVLDYLEEHGLAENTIVVYTSDQGFYMGEHGWFDKRFMYEPSFRTPLIISYPGHCTPGSECYDLVQNIDYAPTYLDYAGVKKDKEMVGMSLKPLVSGQTPKKWRKYLYYHYYDYPAVHMVRRHDGVSDGRFKLIHFYGKGAKGNNDVSYEELYDVLADPMETNNIYGKPGYEKVTARLAKQLEKFRKDQNIDEW